MTVTQVRDGIYLIDVVARADSDQRGSLATLRTLQVAIAERADGAARAVRDVRATDRICP